MAERPATPTRHGIAVWTSPGWLAGAVSWLDGRLADAGVERTGEVEPFRVRPWAAVLRAPTTDGLVWLKAAGPGTAFEVVLYEVLVRVVPDRVLRPLATDTARGWMVLPDAGPTLAQRLSGAAPAEPAEAAELVDAMGAALVDYARLQIDLAPHVDELLAAGVPDMRPEVMPQRFAEAVEIAATTPPPPDDHAGARARARHERIAAMAPTVAAWSERLAASQVPASLDHDDLHFHNVLGGGTEATRFYDWGDAAVAHPFASLLIPLRFVLDARGGDPDDPRDPAVRRLRDAYLAEFRDLAPREDLVATADCACHLAKISRALAWDRATRAAREQGEQLDAGFAAGLFESLVAVLDESPLGDR